MLDKAHDDDGVRAWGPTARDARRVRDELYEKSLTNAGWDDTRAFLAARASTALFDRYHKYVNGAYIMREAQVGVQPGYVDDSDSD